MTNDELLQHKWVTLDNATGDNLLKQHCLISKTRKELWTRKEYEGNISLCGKLMAADENERSMPIKRLEGEILDTESCCKICLKIYQQKL